MEPSAKPSNPSRSASPWRSIAPALGDLAPQPGPALRADRGGRAATGRSDRLPRTVADRLLRPRHGARPGHHARRPRRSSGSWTRRARRPWSPASSKSRRSIASTTRPSTPRAGGSSTSTARSICPPTDCSTSSAYFAAGDRFEAFDTARFGRVGILVLRGFLAPLRGGDHAGRRDRSARLPRRTRPARGVHGPKIRTAEIYEHAGEDVRPIDGRGGHRGQSRRLRGRAVLLGRQHGGRARRGRSPRPRCSTRPCAWRFSTRPNSAASG